MSSAAVCRADAMQKIATRLFLTTLWPVVMLLALVDAQAASNFASNHSLAWAGNIGWLNWRADSDHGVAIDQFVCAGFIYSANVGWINMGSGAPLNGVNYQNNSSADFGVNVGERGELSGLAYGANIGWINFSPTGQPKIDLRTGRLSGFVYGANVGWISLASGGGGESSDTLQIESLGEGKDSDGDGIPDAWELAHVGNLTTFSAAGDFDHDGYSDVAEYLADTDPTDPADNLRILKFSFSLDHSSAVLSWATRFTRQYLVETRSAFDPEAAWQDAGFGTLDASGPIITRDIPLQPEKAQQYFRIRAVRPLSH
jgi:hypothetical protein